MVSQTPELGMAAPGGEDEDEVEFINAVMRDDDVIFNVSTLPPLRSAASATVGELSGSAPVQVSASVPVPAPVEVAAPMEVDDGEVQFRGYFRRGWTFGIEANAPISRT